MSRETAPVLSESVMDKYPVEMEKTSSGDMIYLRYIAIEDLPTGTQQCTYCNCPYFGSNVGIPSDYQPVALICGHVYCKGCAHGWYKRKFSFNLACYDCELERDVPKLNWDEEIIKLQESQQSWVKRKQEWTAARGVQNNSSEGSSSSGMTADTTSSRSSTLSPAPSESKMSHENPVIQAASLKDIKAAEILIEMSRDGAKHVGSIKPRHR